MRLWVDDYRDAPDETWTVVRKVEPAIKALAKFDFLEISLDHDIEGRPDDETFMPVAYFIAEKYWVHRTVPVWPKRVEDLEVMRPLLVPKITIHSINSVGAKEMEMVLRDAGIKAVRAPYKADIERLERETGMNMRKEGEEFI